MRYTQIPTNTFETIQLNAGILATGFDPDTGVVTGIVGATTGGISFEDSKEYIDFGEDIDNCPKNTKELKMLDTREVKLSGTFVTVTRATAKMLVGEASSSSGANDVTVITPTDDLLSSHFMDALWWIGDYSDVNTGGDAGFIAIKLIYVLNTAGFRIQTTDKEKGQFEFEFTGHYSMSNQDEVPYKLYIKSGVETIVPSIELDRSSITIVEEGTYTLTATTVPASAVVTWTANPTSVATVSSNGLVTGVSEGTATITASITEQGETLTDTCTVTVTAGA